MLTVTARLPGENNKDYSYRVIKNAIMRLELHPGQAISEVELADALQLSRTPIREVMAKLKEENLVEVIPQVGTYVSKIKLQLIEEAAFMRYTLEKEVLKLACESFSTEKIVELRENVAAQEELLGKEGMEREFHLLDTSFHSIIFQENKKEHVWGAITRLSTHYNRMRLLSEMEHSFDEAILQHKKIINIIENKEVNKVEDIISQHIIHSKKDWNDLFKTESSYLHYFDQPNTVTVSY